MAIPAITTGPSRNTTRADPVTAGPPPQARAFITALPALAVGAALLFIAVPMTVSSLIMAPAIPVMGAIHDREPVTAKNLQTLIAARTRGLAWGETARKWTDLGLGRLLLTWEKELDSPERAGLLAGAIGALRKGLSLEPADSFAWTQLAYAEHLRQGGTAEVAAALRLAIATAPREPRLVLMHLELAFKAWPSLTPADRDLILRQTRFAWRVDRNRVVDLVWTVGGGNVVRAAIRRRPADLADFEKRLKKRASQKPL